MITLLEYKELLTVMTVNKNGGKIAPHKAILLLAVISLIERGSITNPFVPLSDELVEAFNFQWRMHVPKDSPFICNICYPFFHLHTSPFWQLVRTPAYVGRKEYSSLAPLQRDFSGAAIDEELFQYLSRQEVRYEMCLLLKEAFLSATSQRKTSGLKSLLGAMLCWVA